MSGAGSTSVTRDDQFLVLAFYVVIDVSYSMNDDSSGEAPIMAANQLVPTIIDAIAVNPALADVIRLGVIDFADDARVLLPLGDLRSVQHIPQLAVRGGTSYAAAFRRLRQDIEHDIAQLKSDGFRVYRPTVFFITDGAPTDESDDLRQAFDDLCAPDFRARPNVIPFGVGAATKDLLEPWVHPKGKMRSFVSRDGATAAQALKNVGEILLGSILASASSVSESGEEGGFVLPEDDDDVFM